VAAGWQPMPEDFGVTMDTNWDAFLRLYTLATSPAPALPLRCPNCDARICWGWTEDEMDEPFEEQVVHIRHIPRLDQTVFCPNCEAQILN